MSGAGFMKSMAKGTFVAHGELHAVHVVAERAHQRQRVGRRFAS